MEIAEKKILELDKVTAGYGGEVVLTDVSLEVFDKDFIGIIGPNGGGKTTLLKVITGQLKPFRGTVRLYNGGEARAENLIGYLPQFKSFDHLFPISVPDVVLSGLSSGSRFRKGFSREDRHRVMELLKKMGLSGLVKKPVGELSGGQMQRVFLCRALVSSPRLLLLDEPNTFVDNQFESDLFSTLRELNRSIAIIIVSHDVGTIFSHVKTIACVNGGLHYHKSNIISQEQLAAYNCPIKLLTHGDVPHTVLKKH